MDNDVALLITTDSSPYDAQICDGNSFDPDRIT